LPRRAAASIRAVGIRGIEAQDIEAANYMTGQELVIDGGMTAGGRPPQR
jgi:hypothetical protein